MIDCFCAGGSRTEALVSRFLGSGMPGTGWKPSVLVFQRPGVRQSGVSGP
jgi:hypothetical protein